MMRSLEVRMKTFAATLTIAVVLLGNVAIRAAGSATIVGYISDTKCAAASAKAKTAAEWIKPAAFEQCVKDCVKEGSEAVFVTEDNKILKLDAASAKKASPFLGHKVRVVGDVQGTTISVESITGLKLQ
jgi:hypothetical protein